MAKNAARGPAIPQSLQIRPMAGTAGDGHLINRFMMQKTTAIQGMGGRRQDQRWIIGRPALPMTLVAGWFAL